MNFEQAFPGPSIDYVSAGKNGVAIQRTKIIPGMTLWDYYAGQALAGITAYPDGIDFEVAAKSSYDYADAMITERQKRLEAAGEKN